MYSAFTSEMYKRHVRGVQPQPQVAAEAAALDYEIDEELVDDPEALGAEEVPAQQEVPETDELEDIDYEIVNEIDTIAFNEDLILVRLDTQ